jgi:hypothetical protein
MPMMGAFDSWQAAEADAGTVDEVARAVAYLRPILGEEWKGWANGAPLATVFTLSFQGGPREWVRLHRLVRTLEGVAERDSLVRRDLGSSAWTQYTAAVMALEFCGRLRGTGRAVEFIQATDAKSPDARVELARRWVTVEFKALHDPDEMKPWHALHDWVMGEFARHDLDLGGFEVDCAPAALAVGNRRAFLDGLLAVKRGGCTEYHDLPRQTGRARVVDGNMGHWMFPVTEVPELERVIDKLLGKWWKQLREATTPTVIVVRTRMLFGETLQSVASKGETAAARLREVMEPLPMIGAILIYDEMLWPPPSPAFLERPGYRLSVGAIDGCARAALLIPNDAAAVPLVSEEQDVLARPKMLW